MDKIDYTEKERALLIIIKYHLLIQEQIQWRRKTKENIHAQEREVIVVVVKKSIMTQIKVRLAKKAYTQRRF